MAGSKAAYARWSGSSLVYYTSAGVEIFRVDGSAGILHQFNIERTFRTRVTAAQVNAGLTLVAAIPGYKFRLTDITMVSVGGAAAGATAVIVQGTQAASTVSLISAAVAALTQSAVVKPHTASVTVLADGASFVTCDVNTAITIGKTGSSLTGSTNIDIVMTYAIEV